MHFYATAREHTDATDAETNDLATLARDRAADLESLLLFVELEWLALDDAEADALLAAPELEPYAAPPAGRAGGEAVRPARGRGAGAQRAPPGDLGVGVAARPRARDADRRVRRRRGPEPHTIDRLLSYVHHPDRELRLAALDILYEALDGVADVQAACYDAIVGDRLSVDRLRGIPDADVADEPAQRARRRRSSRR